MEDKKERKTSKILQINDHPTAKAIFGRGDVYMND